MFTVIETYQDSKLSIDAQMALYAASNCRKWGRYATVCYCLNQGISPSLYRLACQLIAGEKVVEYKGISR